MRLLFLSNAPDRLQTAVDWLGTAHREQRSVLVFVPDAANAERLDRLLWSSPQIGFVPHCRAGAARADETPILLTDTLDSAPHQDCLLNLSDAIPPGFDRFAEMVEIISTDDAVKLPGRQRYRHYREQGYAPENIDAAQTT
jgi:DNA polymerase-3 subunit chi